MSDSTIITTLPNGHWRNMVFPPFEAAPLQVEHRLPERKYPYIDVAGHDFTGMDVGPMTFKLLFLNSLLPEATGITGRLFPEYWNRFLTTILDGEPGDLGHPLLGTVRARVKSWSTEASIANQSGIIVNVTYVRTNETPSESELFADLSIGNPSKYAENASTKAAAFKIRLLPSLPYSMMSALFGVLMEQPTIADVWSSLSGRLYSIDLSVLTAIATLMGGIEMMIIELEALDDVLALDAIVACRRFWVWLNTARASMAQATRPTGQEVLKAKTTIDAYARSRKMSVEQAMTLNVRHLVRPEIPSGAVMRYYKAA